MNAAGTPNPTRRDWRRAWRAVRCVIEDSSRSDMVFEVTDALSAPDFERGFRRTAAHPDGQRLLRERPRLIDALRDRDALARLPAGSFGRAYLAFVTAAGISADGLVAADEAVAARKAPGASGWAPDRKYLDERMRDAHDLRHVLTGYGSDESGEVALMAFNAGQVPNLGMALIVAAGAILGPKDPSLRWQRYLVAAFRRGRATPMLSLARYEELLPLPLEAVRRRLRVPPASALHPSGIAVGSRDGDGRARIEWRSPGQEPLLPWPARSDS